MSEQGSRRSRAGKEAGRKMNAFLCSGETEGEMARRKEIKLEGSEWACTVDERR